MKIEIDLNNIFADEGETLHESVQRQVIDRLTDTIKTGIKHKIEEETSILINKELRAALADKMPALLEDILNVEYTPIDSFGRREKPTNFRRQLIEAVAKECTYEPKRSSYDQNTFTKFVSGCIEAQMAAFKKEFDAKINDQFRRDAITYAVTELSKRLGLPAKV